MKWFKSPLMRTTVLKARLSRLLLFAVCMLTFALHGQENHLVKRVNLKSNQWPMSRVLSSIESQGRFFFSYDSDLISSDSVVSIEAENEKVETVLKRLLPARVEYKSVGNHVVIFKPLKKGPTEIVITGYIRDSRSNLPISNATLYNPQYNLMTASNASGYYEMTVSSEPQKLGLTISKAGYRQEVVYLTPMEQSQLDFKLLTLEKPVEGVTAKTITYPDVNERKIVKLMVPERVIENSNNLTLFEKVPVQFSVIPGVSTNGLLNANSTNNFSFNLLAGYSQGTDGMELGSLVNINRKDMNGLQIAGLANVTGRFMKGVQLAGIFNYNGLLFEGVQAAGISNISAGDMKGAQLVGFANILNGDMDGVQISGFGNFTTKSVDGAQISGFLNVAARDVEFAQVSGFMNYSKNIKGVQVAGFVNIATNEVRSAQVSSYANFALHRNQGVQLAGFFNYAHRNDGLQLAFINFADSSSGTPIGFLSLVSKGYHTLELSANETFPLSLAFKTGVPRFYNIFEVGGSESDFHLTYGIGTMPSIGRKWRLSMDLTASAVFNSETPVWNEQRALGRFALAINYQPWKKFGVALGPTLNYYRSPLGAEGSPAPLSYYAFYESTAHGVYEQAWIGGKVSLRFF